MAMPAHQPDDKTRGQVEALAGFGVISDEIAAYIGITGKTLRKHYRKELSVGHVKANVQVARRLFAHATGDSVSAAIFWMKARADWRETTKVEHGGEIGTYNSRNVESRLLPDLASIREAVEACDTEPGGKGAA
jgi:DNA-binding CsgD family transcriptional regulator